MSRREGGVALTAKVLLARAIGRLSRGTGRGGGTTLPGRALLRMDRRAIPRLRARIDGPATLISATNGKTTTAGMLNGILGAAGYRPVHNRTGSNMAWGVATALAEQHGDRLLLEVDEAWLPRVAAEVEPDVILLGNLFRDQLDRYGELESIAAAWAEMVVASDPATTFVLNADDPLIAGICEGMPNPVLTFGIEDPGPALGAVQHAHDAKQCRRCGADLVYDRAYVGHLGHYHCPECGLERPRPDITADRVALRGMDGTSVSVRLPGAEIELELSLPGVYNVYNALAAVAAAHANGIAAETVQTALAATTAVFGRVERIPVGATEVAILLIKNPVGANEVLRTLRLEAERSGEPLVVWAALNDGIADGRDVSWIWDADFDLLAARIDRVICAGTRASDLAVRFKYAGTPEERIEVDRAIDSSFDRALAVAGDRLFALPTYTALIELRRLLAQRGHVEEYWE